MSKQMVRVVAPTTQIGIRLPLVVDADLLDGHNDKIDRSTIRVFPLVYPDDGVTELIEFGDAIVGEQFENDAIPELVQSSCDLLELMLSDKLNENE